MNGHAATEVQSIPPTPTTPVATSIPKQTMAAVTNTAVSNAAAAAAARKATSRQSNVVKEVGYSYCLFLFVF